MAPISVVSGFGAFAPNLLTRDNQTPQHTSTINPARTAALSLIIVSLVVLVGGMFTTRWLRPQRRGDSGSASATVRSPSWSLRTPWTPGTPQVTPPATPYHADLEAMLDRGPPPPLYQNDDPNPLYTSMPVPPSRIHARPARSGDGRSNGDVVRPAPQSTLQRRTPSAISTASTTSSERLPLCLSLALLGSRNGVNMPLQPPPTAIVRGEPLRTDSLTTPAEIKDVPQPSS